MLCQNDVVQGVLVGAKLDSSSQALVDGSCVLYMKHGLVEHVGSNKRSCQAICIGLRGVVESVLKTNGTQL